MTSDKPALTASTEWPERVYELQKTDPVDAGADGIDNLAPNQLAARTNYLRVKGISDWAAVWNYPDGAFCQVAGVVYRAVTANAGKPPASNPAIWTRCPMTAAEIADAINLSDKQPVDATLTALAGLNTSADRLIYATGADQFALTPLTAFIRTLLDDADAATARATLGAAPLASPALTGTPTTPTAADGTNTAQIASTAFVQSAVGGYLSKSVTGGTVTLSDLEASNPVIGFSGTLTSNLVVVVPTTVKRLWAIYNATSGAFTLTVKTATGSGVTVAQGKRNLVYTNGTNVYDGFNDFENIALTGVPTAPTAATGTNTTQVATTEFVNAEIAADRPFEATLANIKMDGAQSVGSLNTVARGDHVHPTDTSRVAKAGDTMSGSLKTRYTGDWVGFSADNPTEGKSTFFNGQVAGVPRGGMQIKPAAGGNGEYFTTIAATPAGATDADRCVGGLDVYAGGLYAYAYGWLHDYFLKSSDCVVGWYPSHYGGAQTFKIRNLNLMITTMYVTGLGADTTLNLPEAYTGVVQAFATDAGSGKNNMGAVAVTGTQVRVYAGPATNTNILLIGYKNNI